MGCNGDKEESSKEKPNFSIKIESPTNLQYFNVNKIDVSGTFSLAEGINLDDVEIRSKSINANSIDAGSFHFNDYELKFGKNKIDIKLLVNGDVKAQTSITVLYSDYYVEILSPYDGQVFRENGTNINGVFEYPQGIEFENLRILIDSNKEAILNTDGTFSYENYTFNPGTHNLTAKILYKNKEKFRDINEVKFYPTNQTPKAKFFANPMEGKSPLKVSIDASSSSDVDGEIKRYLWNFGDGTQLETNTPNVDHLYKWILRGCAGETREHTITLQVVDNDGAVSKTHKKVIGLECEPNSPPTVGNDQIIESSEDQTVSFQVNPANDVDGDPLTYHLVSGPTVGTLTNCLDGSSNLNCTYTPLADYFGTVTFTYKANDGIYDSETYGTITLNILPVNDLPVMKGNQVFAVNEDNSLDFSLNGASDIDGDILSYRIISSPNNSVLENCGSPRSAVGNLLKTNTQA